MQRVENIKKIIEMNFNGNQTLFAKAIKKAPAQVNQWLNGRRNIGNGVAVEIERALNLPIGSLDEDLTQMSIVNHGIQNQATPTHSGSLKTETMPDGSMHPIIPQGSQISINTSDTIITDGKIYQIQIGQDVFIRRLFRQLSGSLKLIADNPTFGTDTLTQDNVQVLGRVVAWTVKDD